MVNLSMSVHSVVTQVARLDRDLWNSISLNDIWQNEHRQWEDII